MNKRTLRVLEYDKILNIFSGYCVSQGAKKRAQRLTPSRDIIKITQMQTETRDAVKRMNQNGNVSFSGVRDIGESLRLLELKSPLSSAELLDIAALLETAETVKSYGNIDVEKEGYTPDSLVEYFGFLSPLREISGEIRRCIISENEYADDASSNLRSIRRKIAETNQRLHQQLDKLIRNDNTRVLLQDALVTMRNGRYCIPVKAEYKSHFPGMIHDQSGTGSTLFIEPIEIVNLNNDIKELENDEHAEIEKILEDLSLLAGNAVDDINENYKNLITLAFIFAKAKYARAINANEPIFNTNGIVDIKRGVHPLLDLKTAVPVDIRLGKDFDLLIITGPNTGGKTVSLKTLGLLTLMGQSGLHIPALYGSQLSVFQDVFADIGDEQSIEQNLSTFSSHMSNTIYIVNHAGPGTLCLFDEPGGGTDPTEGAALAISILTHLMNHGAKVMATTHYSELKTFALSTPGVENASCEFDVETLRPTYKLMIGVPGSSNAFMISRRLGLLPEVIDYAIENIDQNSLEMEKVINELESSRRKIEQDKEYIEELKKEAEQLRKELKTKNETISKKKEDILAKAREEAREIVDDAKKTADEAIREINKWKNNPAKADAKAMEAERARLREKQKKMAANKDRIIPSLKTSGQKSSDFHIGDCVLVLSLNTEGHVVSLPDQKGLVEVEMGILNSRFPISDLLIIEDPELANAPKKRASTGGMNKAYSFKTEINLLGKTVDEALTELEKYLDDALLAHASSVRVVHGKGTGALRKGVHDFLRKKKYVKSFRLGEFGEGDSGVTIVEF